jgi:hypothetical protein
VWSNVLFQFAAIALVAHVLLDLGYRTRQPVSALVGIYCAQFVLMGLALWIARVRHPEPVLAEEHRLWLHGIAYLMACALVRFVNSFQASNSEAFYSTAEYAHFAILAAFLFFLMGGSYWGGSYVIGAGFILVALLASIWQSTAVLAFGIAWSVSLCALAVHVRQLGREAGT